MTDVTFHAIVLRGYFRKDYESIGGGAELKNFMDKLTPKQKCLFNDTEKAACHGRTFGEVKLEMKILHADLYQDMYPKIDMTERHRSFSEYRKYDGISIPNPGDALSEKMGVDGIPAGARRGEAREYKRYLDRHYGRKESQILQLCVVVEG